MGNIFAVFRELYTFFLRISRVETVIWWGGGDGGAWGKFSE